MKTANLEQMAKGMRRYIKDPVAFVREILKVEPDEWQIEFLEALESKGRVAVRSGHGTGKSTVEAWSVLWFLFTRPFPKVVTTAPTRQQLFDILWPEISKWMNQNDILTQYFEWQKTRIVMIQEPERWWASARTATQPDNFAGIHEDHVLIVCDEASGIKDAIFEVAEGALTTKDAKLILCGNPTQLSGEFYDAFHRRRHLYHTMHVSCLDSPRVTKEYIDNLKQKYGEDSQVYKIRVKGDFPDAEPDVFIPLPSIEAAAMRDVVGYDENDEPLLMGQPISIGVDVARFGGDEIVIYYRVGLHVFEPMVFPGMDTTELSGHIVKLGSELMRRWHRPDITVNIDMGAMGPGVYDQVNHTVGQPGFYGNWSVVGCYFGGAGDNECDDEATVMWKQARDMMSEIHLPNDERTIGQLSTRKYNVTPIGKFKIEPKKEYKKRYPEEGSPDRADALILCLRPHSVERPGVVRRKERHSYTKGARGKRF